MAGPDALSLWSPVETRGENLTTVAEFEVNEGEKIPFLLMWHDSHDPPKKRINPLKELKHTVSWWRDWTDKGKCDVPWSAPVKRSLITLKALTFAPTGGVVAAATTSLPEFIGGVRNWDYRCCWLRDATFTLYALMDAGYTEEACAWRDWLVRAVAGDPSKIQIMYGLSGERRLDEYELPWLPGYEGSSPVRVGNAAALQFQLDVYGEVIDAMYKVRLAGMEPEPFSWKIELAMLKFLEEAWTRPDEGIWEVRGKRRHFTHSKMMAWVAFDRAVKTVEKFGFEGEVARWRQKRDRIHDEVCARGFSREKQSFVQEYGHERLDASLLMMPLVGFLPAKDDRVVGTVRAIERELVVDGFVLRYRPETCEDVDALPKGEGCFLLCTFWLADNYALAGRYAEARALYEKLLADTKRRGPAVGRV